MTPPPPPAVAPGSCSRASIVHPNPPWVSLPYQM
ncbi:hypothetical protein ACP70R_030545 [Stipagrostis hirtigluma subsp. patula]